jgi:hypothetical protein
LIGGSRFAWSPNVSVTPVGGQIWLVLQRRPYVIECVATGAHIRIGPARFLILKKLDAKSWQLENTATGEWCRFAEQDLLDRFARHELMFDCNIGDGQPGGNATYHLDRSLSGYPLELVAVGQMPRAVSQGN